MGRRQIALLARKSWLWGPFLLGVGIGIAGIGGYFFLFRVAKRYLRKRGLGTPGRLSEARARLRIVKRLVVSGYLVFGSGFGVVAAGFRAYWPDVVFAGLVVIVGVIIPLGSLPAIARRSRAGGESGCVP